MEHTTPSKNKTRLCQLVGVLLGLSFAIPIVFNRILDIDIWWHLQLGKSALANLSLPNLNDFYFSRVIESPSVYRYTLLGDIIFGVVHKLAGDIGLQVFGAALVALSGWMLWRIGKPKFDFLLLGFFVFIAGTYQLQIMRNALFSLPLLCFLLWTWIEARQNHQSRAWWGIGSSITLWSFVHGSYLLGFGLFLLLFLGDILDQMRLGTLKQMPWRQYGFQIVIALFGIAAFNPLTFQLTNQVLGSFLIVPAAIAGVGIAAVVMWLWRKGFQLHANTQQRLFPLVAGVGFLGVCGSALLHFRKFFGRDLTMAGINLLDPGVATAQTELGFFGRLSFGLNNLVWKTAETDYFSSDFLSPFEGLGELYIWVTFILAIVTAIAMFWSRKLEFTWLLPFVACGVFALGYKRMVGYWAIFCLVYLIRTPLPQFRFRPVVGWTAALCVWLFFWGGFAFKWWDPGLRNFHTVGLGRAPMFSQKAIGALAKKFPEQAVFTTVTNGGFILSRWYPKKKVFIDGFFAPHRGVPLKTYQTILFSGDPDGLTKRLGLKLAVVNYADIKWFLLFNRAPNWYPILADEGMVVYQYQPYFENEVPKLTLFCDLETVKKQPSNYRRLLSNRLFQLQTGYLLKGRIASATTFETQYHQLLEGLPAYADDRIREERDRNMHLAKTRYGKDDNLWLREEYRYQEALSSGHTEAIRRLGGKIFNAFPKRFELAVLLATAGLNEQHLSEVRRYLLAFKRARTEDPDFFANRQTQIAEIFYRASKLMRDKGVIMEAFEALEQAHIILPARFNQDVFFNDSLELYEKLTLEGDTLAAYQLLVRLELKNPENPFIQHLLSVTAHDHAEELKLPLVTALEYGKRAIELATNEPEAPLEAFRENVARILEKLGRHEDAARYRQTP